jgi:hypothetical protein
MKTIDEINQTVNKINLNVSDLEIKFKTLEKRVLETELACHFTSYTVENNKIELNSTKKDLNLYEIGWKLLRNYQTKV